MENVGDRHHKQCLTGMTASNKAEYQNIKKMQTSIHLQLL